MENLRRSKRRTTLVLYDRDTNSNQNVYEQPMISKEDKQIMQMYKGQLNLQIHKEDGNLKIYVKQARDLFSLHGDPLRTFVKLSILPKSKNSNISYKTNVFNGHTIHHYYNDSFIIDTSNLPNNARLVASVWNIGKSHESYELLGCMSFGITKIMRRINKENMVDGWYFLLNDEIGSRKHLKVIKTKEIYTKKNIYFLDKYTISIPNVNSTFGFRIFNVFDEINKSVCQTCRVKNISKDSPSYLSGLRDGDILKRINGIEVSSLFVDVISNIIRNCGKELKLEINRKNSIDTLLCSPGIKRRKPLPPCDQQVDINTYENINAVLDNVDNRSLNRIYDNCVTQTMKCSFSRD